MWAAYMYEAITKSAGTGTSNAGPLMLSAIHSPATELVLDDRAQLLINECHHDGDSGEDGQAAQLVIGGGE